MSHLKYEKATDFILKLVADSSMPVRYKDFFESDYHDKWALKKSIERLSKLGYIHRISRGHYVMGSPKVDGRSLVSQRIQAEILAVINANPGIAIVDLHPKIKQTRSLKVLRRNVNKMIEKRMLIRTRINRFYRYFVIAKTSV